MVSVFMRRVKVTAGNLRRGKLNVLRDNGKVTNIHVGRQTLREVDCADGTVGR